MSGYLDHTTHFMSLKQKILNKSWITRERLIVFSLYFVFSVSILTVGITVSERNKEQLKASVQKELSSVAKIKIDQISNWYKGELQDADYISQNSMLIRQIESCYSGNQFKVTESLRINLMEVIFEHSLYKIELVSPELELLVSTSELHLEFEPEVLNSIEKSFQTKKTETTGLYACNHFNKIQFSITSPIFSSENKLIALIVFTIDADEFLYPFIQQWPLPSKTAESLIIRKEGDHVLFLNELRHVKQTALKLSIPLTQKSVPAVMAVDGYVGIFEGVDYRGVDVVSYVSKIPDTPWYIVAKVDKEELYKSVNKFSIATLIIIVILLLLLLFVFAFIYNLNQKNTYKTLFLTQEEFKTTLYSIGDGVITTDKHGLIKNINSIAEKLTGWSESDAINKPVAEVFKIVNEETFNLVDSPVDKVIEQGTIVGLANHTLLISKDGKHIPIADSGAPIFDEQGLIKGVVLVFRDQTDERKSSSIIKESRRQLLTLMSNLPGMAYRCKNDEKRTMEFVSKGCLNLTGFDIDDLVLNKQIAFGELVLKTDQELVKEQIQEAIKGNNIFEIEYRIKTGNNKIKWVWEKGQVIYNDSGGIIALEGFIKDITERKEFEYALQKSEHLFQTLSENSSVGIFKTNEVGDTIYVNPKWCEISGLAEHEAMNNGWLKNIHPDDREMLLAIWKDDILSKQNSIAEYRFVHNDGSIVYVKGQAVPELNDKNELLGYIGTITDITEVKNAEEQLVSSNLLLRTFIDNIPDAIYLKDIKGRKLLANKADVRNIGLENESDVIGKTDFDLFPKEIAEQFWNKDQQVLKNGKKIIDVEEELINEKNEKKWLSTSKIPYCNAEGKIIGLVGIGHDITRRKKDEEEKLNMVKELIIAKNKAEEGDRLKTSFLANMSHEIRTPLNSILGFTSILTEMDDLSDKERDEYTSIIKNSGDSLLQIINDIIDISSLETGQLQITNSSFKISDLLKSLEVEFGKKLKQLNKTELTLNIVDFDDDIQIETDRNRLNQIFINLLTNSVKFTNKGFIEFGIIKCDKKNVYFKVSDTGKGIDKNLHTAIFERFRQGEESNTRHYGGNGLGLAIVKNLVGLMGGEISVESELGKGSTFLFNLPLVTPKKK